MAEPRGAPSPALVHAAKQDAWEAATQRLDPQGVTIEVLGQHPAHSQ